MVGRVFLGRYEIVRLLGEGGMGRVYLAKQADLGRQVVVKVMHEHVAADPKFRDRFQRETKIMARFQHPYAVTLYDASLDSPEGPCIIMEYIRGITLDDLLLRNTRLSPVRVSRLLEQICEVLQAAHGEGIIHRDLKPANIMVVDPDTPYEKIKVMDFGLAKLADPQRFSVERVTDTNIEFAVGTPGYICPEQVRGEQMDHRGDLYSIGIILYELLTGRLPFDRRSTMDVLLAHATESPPSFSERGADAWVPAGIEAVVVACLAKNAADRPQSARDLFQRYAAALEQARMDHALLPAQAGMPPTEDDIATPDDAPPETGEEELEPISEDGALVHHLEAWMPEAIAKYKLRGFVQEVGGEVIESVPGMIRVRLGHRSFSWLGLARRSGVIDMELRLQEADPTRAGLLDITVVMRPVNARLMQDAEWRARSDHVFIELLAYMMGQA
jgi:serine/threonine-protein kinase